MLTFLLPEEEILRHPYSVKCWIKYIEHKQMKSDHAHSSGVNLIYERALRVLPGRYDNIYIYAFIVGRGNLNLL